MAPAFGTYRRHKKCIQRFSRENCDYFEAIDVNGILTLINGLTEKV